MVTSFLLYPVQMLLVGMYAKYFHQIFVAEKRPTGLSLPGVRRFIALFVQALIKQ